VFLHPEHFDAAVRARKHVYCEKPAGADIEGVGRVIRAARDAYPSKHTIFGLQRRYAPQYLKAAQAVASGQIGPLLYMKSNWVSWGVLAKPFTPNAAWGQEERRIRYWPHFKETSGDFIVEQDCHGVDVLNWFSGTHPVSATGSAGRGHRQYGDDSDWFHITYTYPNGLTGLLVGTQLCQQRFSDVKEQFMGLEGTVETHLHYYRLTRGPGDVTQMNINYDVTTDAVRDFVDKISAGKPENTAAVACESTLTALLGRVAAELRREVTWSELTSRITL
jgi:predicted dehydrogenase